MKDGGGSLCVGALDSGAGVTVAAGGVELTGSAQTAAPAGDPAFWVDASAAESLLRDSQNGVACWFDRWRDGSAFYATNLYNKPVWTDSALNGLPVLDFGVMADSDKKRAGDNRMMKFRDRMNGIRSVFWVIGSRNGGGFLLGDDQVNGARRHFHRGRGPDATYGALASDPVWGDAALDKGLVCAGETRLNGVVADGRTTGLGGGFDLVSWRLSPENDAASATPSALWFASCYAASNGRLNGGQELGEVLIYTNRLSDAEMRQTSSYLARKWFPDRTGGILVPVLSLGAVTVADGGSFRVTGAVALDIADMTIAGGAADIAGFSGSVPLTVGVLRVVAGGALNPSAFASVAVRDLVFEEGASVAVAADEEGTVPSLAVSGTVAFPASLAYRVTVPDGVKIRGRQTVLSVEGGWTGVPVLTAERGSARGCRLDNDIAGKRLSLVGMDGTLFFFR